MSLLLLDSTSNASIAYLVDYMAYHMSKAALKIITVCHAAQFKPGGCKVWIYNPGFVVRDVWAGVKKQDRK